MLFVLRMIAVAVFTVVMFVLGCGYCLLSPRNPRNVYIVGRHFCKMARIFGIKLEFRYPDGELPAPSVYLANHQNNYDLFTVSGAIQPRTVTVGKKSISWMPLFGQLYWLTGNILIDRANRSKAVGTIGQVVEQIKQRDVSIWMFPEGTRSRGRGLLPFKTGAFHAAISAGVPVVPIVCSSTENVKLNKWDNGVVIVEVLPSVSVDGMTKEDVRTLSNQCRDMMAIKLDELNAEATRRSIK
ncbi:1-acylglycerol-3-phosphate O-acyltransferase [Photobacterium lutimaris]|uniref:1-acyl-sn-glycerol-3-phosphate acyltransferase n=1 Tax=Photobacterium lutimaris TaxID=388278 RepID=A0A2T3IRF2_9GAMM|nr:1-acylglycerol-3-phosphate O-acyltransferase [Photobacterium lutimaris]PSU30922.1 1-acyl-sn-glycerol-3-phosphate acyltransferase [Photobacterium lutimaris]TDR72158.1 1-acyl-sn-glycerol-3-phosphate acyltransferase [Photobacterium lutimaris]